MHRILIAEDDPNIRDGLADAFELEGYAVAAASDGAETIRLYNSFKPNLLLLDIMMPALNGYEVCRQIRRGNPALPIIFLSARSEEVDKVLGLGLGADDYVTKPFSLRELLARVAARLRPRAALAANPSEAFDFAGWRIDPEKAVASRGDAEAALSARELALLKLFAAHPGELLPRERIMKEVWGSSFNCSRTLDQHVVTLRKKLSPDIVATVYGRGYRPGG